MLLKQIVNGSINSLLYLEIYVNYDFPRGFIFIYKPHMKHFLLVIEIPFAYIYYVKDSIETNGILPSFLEKFGCNKIFVYLI